jgi:DNA-binding YbaB/EbfC family protein
MGGGMGMMQQMQQLQQQMAAAQEALAEETVTATAGGGVITVVSTGDQQIQSITIAPDILEDADVEMLQDLILTAVNSALDQSREMAAERLGPLAGGLPF